MKYLAMHNGMWGKGDTKVAALLRLKQEGADSSLCLKDVTIYSCPDDYCIDEYGRGFGSGQVKLISGPDLRD